MAETVKEVMEFFIKNPNNIINNIYISKAEKVVDGKRFLRTCIDTLKEHTGDKRWMPTYTRLINYYKLCKDGN